MKLSHRIQVSLYHEMLRFFVRDRVKRTDGARIEVNIRGGIWLRGESKPTEIDLEPSVRFLSRFFSKSGKFGALLHQARRGSGIRHVPWHLDKKCSTCPYIAYCKSSATRDGKTDLSFIHKIGKQEKILVSSYVREQTGVYVSDIEEAHRVLSLSADSSTEKAKLLKVEDKSSEEELTRAMASLSVADTKQQPVDSLSNQLSAVSLESTASSAHTTESSSPPKPSLPQALLQRLAAGLPSSPSTPPQSPTTIQLATEAANFSPSIITTDAPSTPFVSAPKKAKRRTSTAKTKPYLPRELWTISRRVESFVTKSALTLCRASHELVGSEDCAVHVSVYQDNPRARLFSWSIFMQPRKKTILDRLKKLAKDDNWASILTPAPAAPSGESSASSFLHEVEATERGLHVSLTLADSRAPTNLTLNLFVEKSFCEALYRCLDYCAEVRNPLRSALLSSDEPVCRILLRKILSQFLCGAQRKPTLFKGS